MTECKECKGSGVVYYPYGEDDYYKDSCACIDSLDNTPPTI